MRADGLSSAGMLCVHLGEWNFLDFQSCIDFFFINFMSSCPEMSFGAQKREKVIDRVQKLFLKWGNP
jgi:hypothetical protein